METSLHRQLKHLYAEPNAQLEARLGKYRIDVVNPDHLVEIQHGSLAAIRGKLSHLLAEHDVLVVKPVVAEKILVRQNRRGGKELSRRRSPKRCGMLDLFAELVYFARVFPHPRLALEVVLVEVEEWRYPGHGRRRRWRRNDEIVEDQKLLAVRQSQRFQTAADLLTLLPPLPAVFDTAALAELVGVKRWYAQQIAYCLRETGAVTCAGKQRNSLLYAVPKPKQRRRRTAA